MFHKLQIINNTMRQQKKENISETKDDSKVDKVYIRQSDGTTYQLIFENHKKLRDILLAIYQQQPNQQNLLISKGRLLDIDKSLGQNNVKQAQIIHILKKSHSHQQRHNNIAYIGFQNKLHRVQFTDDDLVGELKSKIQSLLNVSKDTQSLSFNAYDLEDSKKLISYGVKNQDILNLDVLQPNSSGMSYLSVNKRTFPIKINSRNRRGSEGYAKGQQKQKLNQTQASKLIKSGFNFASNDKQQQANKQISQPNVAIFGPSSSQNQEYENQTSQQNLINNQQPQTRSQQLNSPNILNNFQNQANPFAKCNQIFKERHIFGRLNSFDRDELLLKENNQQNNINSFDQFNLKCDGSPLSFQAALNNLMVPGNQQIVFCESYYQQEPGAALKKSSKQIEIKESKELQINQSNEKKSNRIKQAVSYQWQQSSDQLVKNEQSQKESN